MSAAGPHRGTTEGPTEDDESSHDRPRETPTTKGSGEKKKEEKWYVNDIQERGGIRHVPALLVLFSMYMGKSTSGVLAFSEQIHLTIFTYLHVG